MTENPFVAHRSLLFTVAYEMLGSAADAEDVVQESWLRWADDAPTAITAPTLVFAGGSDNHPPQERIAEMAGRFPAGRLLTIPAGHRVHATRPVEFCAAVEEFLKG